MKDIVERLLRAEMAIGDFYKEASEFFKKDSELSQFLLFLSGDERYHYAILLKASAYIKDLAEQSHLVKVGGEVAKKFSSLGACRKKIEEGAFTKGDLLICMADIELSEWNDIFLYVINSLKHLSVEFIPVAANIQQHKRSIERWMESQPEAERLLKDLRNLPPVWQEKILIVDNSAATLELLSAILSKEGVTVAASDANEALERIKSEYFTAIVTDVDLPVMDGIQLYKMIVEKRPEMKGCFLFFTGDDAPEVISFLNKNNLRYLIKPVHINEIREAVIEIIDRRKA